MSKKKSKSLKRTRISKHRPLTKAALEKWSDLGGLHCDQINPKKPRGLDDRILTIPPAVLGLMSGLKKDRITPDIVRLANRAIGLRSPDAFKGLDRDKDRNRAHVVLDWATRFALPIWLDRLPKWCAARETADSMRKHEGLHWRNEYIRMIHLVGVADGGISEGDIRYQGTGTERQIIARVAEISGELLGLLTEELYRLTDEWGARGREDDRLCHRVLRAVACATKWGDPDDPEITASFPQLFDVVLAVTPGDSQSSVNSRCVWKLSGKRRAA